MCDGREGNIRNGREYIFFSKISSYYAVYMCCAYPLV